LIVKAVVVHIKIRVESCFWDEPMLSKKVKWSCSRKQRKPSIWFELHRVRVRRAN